MGCVMCLSLFALPPITAFLRGVSRGVIIFYYLIFFPGGLYAPPPVGGDGRGSGWALAPHPSVFWRPFSLGGMSTLTPGLHFTNLLTEKNNWEKKRLDAVFVNKLTTFT